MVEYLHLAVERIISLEELSVPPKKYSNFLSDCVDSLTSSILEYHKSKTFEEALEKHKKQVRKLNPGKTDKELFISEYPFASFFIKGQLEFSEPTKRKRKNIYRKISRFEDLIDGKFHSPYGIPLSIDNYKKELLESVSDFKKALDRKYPNRQNKIHSADLFSYKTPRGFKLNLHLESHQTNELEANITLCDYGCTSSGSLKDRSWDAIPGIKLEAELLFGSLTFPKKIVNKLEEVVKKHYSQREGMGISHKISYNECDYK